MIQYNILSAIKRFNDYETVGELFRAANKDAVKLTISEQIWLIIINLVSELSEMLNIETELLMEKIFTDNEKLTKHLNLNSLMQAG